MTRLPSSVLAFLVSVGVTLAAESDAWQVVFTTPQEFTAIDEPIVCILNIQHPDIIRKQLAGKPAAEDSGLKNGCSPTNCVMLLNTHKPIATSQQEYHHEAPLKSS